MAPIESGPPLRDRQRMTEPRTPRRTATALALLATVLMACTDRSAPDPEAVADGQDWKFAEEVPDAYREASLNIADGGLYSINPDGTNDAPLVDVDASQLTGSLAEIAEDSADPLEGSALSTGGAIAFTDADLSDTPTVAVENGVVTVAYTPAGGSEATLTLDPSARLLRGSDASEVWSLYIELESGHRIAQQFLLSNVGPGNHNAVALGHLIEDRLHQLLGPLGS